MRRLLCVFALAATGLVAAGCGSATSDSEVAASGADATTILRSIDVNGAVGKPAKASMTLEADLNGTLKDPQLATFLGDGPIRVALEGVSNGDGTAVDMTFDAAVGKLALTGGLRVAGKQAFIKISERWYALPTDALGENAASVVDQKKIMAALGDVTELIDNPSVVGADEVNGVAADHVRGTVDVPALVAMIGRVAPTVGGATDVITPEQIAEATEQIQKYLKSADVDVWVAQENKTLVRLALNVDVALDEKAKAESGLDGASVRLDVSGTELDEAPKVDAPDNPGTEEELGQALLPLLFGALGTP